MYGYLKRKPKKPVKIATAFPFLFLLAGLVLISSVLWPLAQWQFFYLPQAPPDKFISPVPANFSPQVLAMATQNSWLPKATSPAVPKIRFYTLSIPKLRVDNATVEFGATDLKSSLVGWNNSALPGTIGTNIIFGHSSLPQFYDPKNYLSIFSLLPTLKNGDPLYVNYDGVSYKYQVIEMKTVNPEDYSILDQRFDDSYLTLITCVPPGTYWKRLLVRAKIVKF